MKFSFKLQKIFIIAILLFFGQTTYAQTTTPDLKKIDLKQYNFIDSAGKPTNFKKFKGKYILLDVWASWCRPCISKFPAFDSLKHVYKDKNIVFLQLSCDTDIRRWRNGMAFTGRSGDQWFIDGNEKFMSDLKIDAIPRYLLIDRKGNIIDPKLIWKDNSKIDNQLINLKGI